MKRQLQGIALILFGVLLELIVMIDPWLPIVEGIGQGVMLWLGLLLGIIGLIFCFQKGKGE